MILETDRLILREITLADTKDMLALHGNDVVQKHTLEPTITSFHEMEKIIQERMLNYKKYGYGRWAVILKPTNKFVGWAGLAYLPEFDLTDLGYRLLPEFWGQGIATEASKAILSYGFETLKLKKIVAIALKEHKASIKVMENAGMTFDKFSPYEPGVEDLAWYSCKPKDRFSANN
jgi:ribosomal-protein-alanine N-acetyltransferase